MSDSVPAALPTEPPLGWRSRLRLAPAQVRFWGLLVPIHVAAFVALYLGTFGLLERAYSEAGATAARFQLDQAVRDMPFIAQGAGTDRNPHVFAHLLAVHEPIGLRLYRTDGSPLGASNISPDRTEQQRVRDFLTAAGRLHETWIERDARSRYWVRGIVRLRADPPCTSCHESGATLGVATMKLDFTEELVEIRRLLRSRVALLLGAWLVLIVAVTVLVQRVVRRSVRRLDAELRDASTPEATPASGIALDPVAAEVHRALRELVARQRAREADVAHRLAHVDQLAGLGQLAAGLAHEIKNPLAGIHGALELLRDESSSEEQTRLFDEMLSELRRVNEILHRLLESGRPAPLHRVRTELAGLLEDTAELLRPSLRRQHVDLLVETAELLPAIDLDRAKIRQVLVNLIQNAAEAMAEDGGKIVVRASGIPGEQAVVVAVEDDGPGIADDQLQRVFEPFFTTKFAGTGLGLAISKGLVEQHGGRLEVTSELGRGTSFVLVLPLLAEQDSSTPDATEPT